MSKLRITLTERGDEIRGTVELPSDPAFTLEALALVIETFSKRSGVEPREILCDIQRTITKGKT